MIRLVYKAIWTVCFVIRSKVDTFLFRFLLTILGVIKGKGIQAYGAIPMLRINKAAGTIQIGDNCVFNNFNDAGWYSKCSLWVRPHAQIIIGEHCGFNGVLLYAAQRIEIGRHVKVGGGTRIFDSDFHSLNFIERRNTDKGTKTAPVVIGDDVFIGTNCIICKGVTIGARSIIAAGSVVVKSIPSDEIWGGNPAKFIRKI